MLPDFLKTKEKLQKMLNDEMQKARLSHMGPLAVVPESIIFEGNKTVVARADGSIDEENLESATVKYNGPQYSGHELSKIYRLTHSYPWRSEYVNQTDSSYSEVQVSNRS